MVARLWRPNTLRVKSGDTWEAAKSANVSFGQSNSNINDTKTVIIHIHPQDRLKATRAPRDKLTCVTVTSPLPEPDVD